MGRRGASGKRREKERGLKTNGGRSGGREAVSDVERERYRVAGSFKMEGRVPLRDGKLIRKGRRSIGREEEQKKRENGTEKVGWEGKKK